MFYNMVLQCSVLPDGFTSLDRFLAFKKMYGFYQNYEKNKNSTNLEGRIEKSNEFLIQRTKQVGNLSAPSTPPSPIHLRRLSLFQISSQTQKVNVGKWCLR